MSRADWLALPALRCISQEEGCSDNKRSCLCWESVLWGHAPPGEETLWALIQESGSFSGGGLRVLRLSPPGCPGGPKKRPDKQGREDSAQG